MTLQVVSVLSKSKAAIFVRGAERGSRRTMRLGFGALHALAKALDADAAESQFDAALGAALGATAGAGLRESPGFAFFAVARGGCVPAGGAVRSLVGGCSVVGVAPAADVSPWLLLAPYLAS